ncbi:hypothetical protein L6452_17532 [Arctium lappa]|uniref:Uncharacterized protein n=1 Tax=Arctium lappa TaxID=4217 RepID=A0ACB9C3P2_ARCLA|nr:hypothetical protein L6452_17532 [Arctium lappa]
MLKWTTVNTTVTFQSFSHDPLYFTHLSSSSPLPFLNPSHLFFSHSQFPQSFSVSKPNFQFNPLSILITFSISILILILILISISISVSVSILSVF